MAKKQLKRSGGRYYEKKVRVGNNPDGTRRYVSVYGKTLSERDRKALDAQEAYKTQQVITNKKDTLIAVARRWHKATQTTERMGTYSKYLGIVKNQIAKSVLANKPISQCTSEDISGLLTNIENQGKHATALSTKAVLLLVFEFAANNEMVRANIVKTSKKVQKLESHRRPLEEWEIDALLSGIISPTQELIIVLGAFMGLRFGEFIPLTAGDLAGEYLYVSKSIKKSLSGQVIDDKAKTPAGVRKIYIPPIVRKHYLKLGINKGYLFLKDGEIYTHNKMEKEIAAIVKLAQGIETPVRRFTHHELRHTFCTLMYYAKIDVRAAMYLMGHANIQTTSQIYTHIENENLRNDKRYSKYTDEIKCQTES